MVERVGRAVVAIAAIAMALPAYTDGRSQRSIRRRTHLKRVVNAGPSAIQMLTRVARRPRSMQASRTDAYSNERVVDVERGIVDGGLSHVPVAKNTARQCRVTGNLDQRGDRPVLAEERLPDVSQIAIAQAY